MESIIQQQQHSVVGEIGDNPEFQQVLDIAEFLQMQVNYLYL
ncbi:hypothetical protein [Bacillus sp. B1-b2]|nr:hypothetical protein [Bacillus sp. B1-b2]